MLVEYKADIIIISSNLAMISMGKTIARWLKQQTITYVTTKIDERNLFSCDEGCSDGRRVVTSDVLMGGELWRVMYWWEPSCDEWCTDGSRVVTVTYWWEASCDEWCTDGRRVVMRDDLMGGELWRVMYWWKSTQWAICFSLLRYLMPLSAIFQQYV